VKRVVSFAALAVVVSCATSAAAQEEVENPRPRFQFTSSLAGTEMYTGIFDDKFAATEVALMLGAARTTDGYTLSIGGVPSVTLASTPQGRRITAPAADAVIRFGDRVRFGGGIRFGAISIARSTGGDAQSSANLGLFAAITADLVRFGDTGAIFVTAKGVMSFYLPGIGAGLGVRFL